jgi:hypothetical protein
MTREESLIWESALTRRAVSSAQEMLVNDSRAGLTPAQMVERKLVTLLRSTPMPASHLQSMRMRRALS